MLRKFWKGIIIGLLLIFGQNTFAATTELGLGDTFKYSLISVGDILKVPEGATGCTIHDDSIPGTLDLDEQVGADTLGAELLTDPGLANWDGADDLIDWTEASEDVNNYITEHVNGAQLVSNNTAGVLFLQNIVSEGEKLYKLEVVISNYVEGDCRLLIEDQTNSEDILPVVNMGWTANGTYLFYFTTPVGCISTRFIFYRAIGMFTDLVYDSISVKEVTSDTGIYNTWITTVDPAGLDATEPVLFFNCAFVESEAAIEAKDADDILYFDDECQFSIVEADCFRDYASADYHLTAGSPLKDAGEAYLNITNLDTSDFSVGVDDYTAARLHTLTGNHDAVSDGVTSKDDCLMGAADNINSNHAVYIQKADNGMSDQYNFKMTYSFYIPAAQTHVDGLKIQFWNGSAGVIIADHTGINGAWVTNTVYWSALETATMDLIIYMRDGALGSFIGDNDGTGDLLYLHNVEIGYDAGDIDLEGRITPIGAGYDIGAYELRLSGGSMGMGMGLRGYCPHRPED